MSRRAARGEAAGAREPRALGDLLGELVAAQPGAGGGAGAAGEHPDPEKLLAYQAGRLAAEEETALQDHLATCPGCAAALLDLEAFAAAAAEPDREAPADLATATAWRALAPRLAAAAGDTPRSAAAGAAGARAPWRRAVAASLLVAVPVLALLLAQSRQQVDSLRQALTTPQTGVPVLYLDAATRDDEIVGPVLELPPGDAFFLLAVTSDAAVAAPPYRVEIADLGGRVIWREDGVPLSDHGTVRVGFTRHALPPGRYRLELTSEADGGPPTLYPFTLRPPA